MAEDRETEQFRTLGDRYRARKRLRALIATYCAARRRVITDDDFTNADNFLEGENDLARNH